MGKPMTAEDNATLQNMLQGLIMDSAKTATSGSSFQETVEENLSNQSLDVSNDGVAHEPKKPTSPLIRVKPALRVIEGGLDPDSRQILNESQEENKKIETDGYFKTTKDKKPVSQEDIDREFGEIEEAVKRVTDEIINQQTNPIPEFEASNSDDKRFKNNTKSMEDLVHHGANNIIKPPKKTKAMVEAERKAAKSKKTEWINNESYYKKNTCESNGRTINYQDRAERVNWGEVLADSSLSPEDTIEKLKNLVTKSVRDGYGGWDRIETIIVRDQKLIINNVAFLPVIEPKYLTDKIFPWDVVDYLKEGAIAMFFDWWALKYMHNLALLDIDDTTLFVNTIDTDLGCRGRIGVSTMYSTCKKLQTFILGGDVTTRETLYKPESRVVKEKVASGKRLRKLSGGLKLDVVGTTGRFQDYTFNNMVNYANSRGDKGLIHFCCGTLARAGLTGVAAVTNIGTHLIKGVIDVFKDATTPVTEDDLS